MKIRVTAGKIVQMISIVWPSSKNRLINLLKNNENINCPTKTVIITKINNVWSWKKDNCSIKGDALSWREINFHVVISKKSLNFIFGV